MTKYSPASLLLATTLTLATTPTGAELNLDLPDVNLPDLGDPASSVMSSTEESLLGVSLLRNLRGNRSIVEDPELSEWLRALGNRLATKAPGSGNYYFLIENNPQINAYAMPGGVIVLHAGLILNTDSESELAGVIAHEIAHVSQRHIARRLAEQNNPLVTGLGILAGAAAASKSTEAAEAIISTTVATQIHRQLVFSQQMESEADRVGLRILAASGFNPDALPVFLEKLDRRTSDLYGDITQYLRTHPLTIDRISDTRSRARQAGKGNVREDADYLYAREKLRALTTSGAPARTQGDEALTRYAQAMRQLRSGNGKAALQHLGGDTQALPAKLAKAEAFNKLRRYADTEKLLTPLARAYPGQESILTPLAEALLASKKAGEAWQLVSRSQLSEQTSLEFLEVRQRVAEQAGQPAEAYRSAAERSLRMGDYKRARAILDQAARLPKTQPHTAARLQAMSREIGRFESKKQMIQRN